MFDVFGSIALICALVSLLVLSAGYLAIFWHLGHRPPAAAVFGVSILKPLKGVDDGLLDNLREQGVELRGATPFEVFRSRLGRRSRSQLDDYDWVGEPDAVAAVRDAWFAFGPAEQPIIE